MKRQIRKEASIPRESMLWQCVPYDVLRIQIYRSRREIGKASKSLPRFDLQWSNHRRVHNSLHSCLIVPRREAVRRGEEQPSFSVGRSPNKMISCATLQQVHKEENMCSADGSPLLRPMFVHREINDNCTVLQ
jgi:hypothetical protein